MKNKINQFKTLQQLNSFEKKNKVKIIDIDYINNEWSVTYIKIKN